jgi:hypothetical protein
VKSTSSKPANKVPVIFTSCWFIWFGGNAWTWTQKINFEKSGGHSRNTTCLFASEHGIPFYTLL